MRGPCNCNSSGKRKPQLHVACNCNRDVIQQLTFAEEEKKKERTKRTKSNKKEKVRAAFLPWIPKGVLRTQQSNFVYSTKLQQNLLHSTTLVALV